MIRAQKELEIWFQDLRLALLKPLVLLLAWLGVHAWAISTLGLVSAGAMFYFIINNNKLFALIAFLMNIIMDGLDGTLARYRKETSDKGKFFDMTVDNVSATLLVLGLMVISEISLMRGAIFIYLMLLTVIFAVIINNRRIKSDWFFHARAGYFAHFPKCTLFLFFVLWSLNVVNYLNDVIFLFNIYYVLLALVNFIRIQSLRRNKVDRLFPR